MRGSRPDCGVALLMDAACSRDSLTWQGLDYFKSITPNDAYWIGRYTESREPNGIHRYQ